MFPLIMRRHSAVHRNGLLHNAGQRYENKSSPISKRWKTVFVQEGKRPRQTWGEMMELDNTLV